MTNKSSFSIQGHRGARGLMPENTLPAFLKALELGVDVLELDVCISKDNKVVVSHEPYFNADFSVKPNGKKISHDEEKEYNLYKINYEEIQKFDVGINGNQHFPSQQKISCYKPLLSEVLDLSEKINPAIVYNIEIKSNKKLYGITQPNTIETFCNLVYNEIQHLLPEKIIIQSFDFNILKFWHQQILKKSFHRCSLAALVERKSLENTLTELKFKPDVFSPNYKNLTEKTTFDCKSNNIKIIPWTVNEIEDIIKLKKWGVDGLISDYPDRVISEKE
ncbi:MAG: glycerophosphodiester phosphodiesterase [Pseudarcicella sp.]|nr:glycerophosphodiester phosphodiesterase [Pseudarcicella sp.]